MRRTLSVVSALAIVPGLWMSAGQAAPTPTEPSAYASHAAPGDGGLVPRDERAAAQPTHVTLLTGDRVEVTPLSDGRSAVHITPADREGGTPSFLTVEREGDLHVIPDDVHSLIPSRLDPALFNVTQLIEQGFDDASYDSLPLIVKHREGRRARIPDVEVTRRLESIDSTAVHLDKERTADIGAALATAAEATTERGRAATLSGPLAGVERISLDGRVEALLDTSVGQIGAPAAWAAGLDGSGVTVAVIDSGIDASHPDLADGVVGERNFTDDPTASDGHGHGTHVASTVAGTGAASDGNYRGVAPGVELLSGKVLDNSGSGLFSWTVDAMEWAAEQGADIVNLSLGPRIIGQGAEMSEAADALTEQYGTLFVAAAGNNGCVGCVSHPAAAQSALAVGAVNKSDRLAEFSSRGPMPDTSAVKPDVTAPGVSIVAARAEGTAMGFPVGNDHYTMADGTSMAAPHVAGAAALLLQAEPSLRPADLKSWVMNTAEPQANATVYQQGAGRVAVERALASRVLAMPASVSFGYYPWPHEGRDADSETITYRNLTDDDIVLDLSVEVTSQNGAAAQDGTLTTSAPSVTVPAGGTASVDLVLDTSRGAPGLFGGHLIAEAADGTTVHTPVGYHQERELVELRVSGISRDGRPAPGSATIFNVDDGSVEGNRSLTGDPAAPCTEDQYAQSTCMLVPPGTYSVLGFVDTLPTYEQPPFSATPLNRSLVGDPEIEITEDTEVVLDARKATEVLIDTPDHETGRNLGAALEIAYHRVPAQGNPISVGRTMWPGAMLEERVFLQPMDEVSTGEFTAYTRWRLEAPWITLDVTDRQDVDLNPMYYRASSLSDFSSQFPMLEGELEAEIVDAGLGRAQDVSAVDLDGKVALIRRSDSIPVAEQSNNAAGAGAKLVVVYNDVAGPNSNPGPPTALLQVPTMWISHEEGESVRALLADGPVRVAAHGTPASPYGYELILTEEGSIPADLHYVVDTDQLARIDSPIHSQLAEEHTVTMMWFPYQAWQSFSTTQPVAVRGGPRTLVNYLTAGPSLRWSSTVRTPEPQYSWNFGPYEPKVNLNLTGELRSYDAGGHYRHSWGEQPLAPAASPLDPPTRTDDTVQLSVGILDSAGNFESVSTSGFDGGLTTDFRIFRGEEYIGGTTFTPMVAFEAEPEPTRYRIEYDVDNDADWAQVSTRTRSVWTFESRRPASGEQRVEPILGVDYDFDVDLLNRAPSARERRGPHQIGLTFAHPDGADQIPVNEVALAVSYDDGETWQDVRNIRKQGSNHYVATLTNGGTLRHNGFLAVKLSAADQQGNTLEQEIIRAYALP